MLKNPYTKDYQRCEVLKLNFSNCQNVNAYGLCCACVSFFVFCRMHGKWQSLKNFDAMKSIVSLNTHLKLFKTNFDFFLWLLKKNLKLFEFVTFFQKNRCFSMIFFKIVIFWDFPSFFLQNIIFVQNSNYFRESSFYSINLISCDSESWDQALYNDMNHYIDKSHLKDTIWS